MASGSGDNIFLNRRVCIVGAGLSGLLAAKYLLQHNIKPVVFEAKENVGGVWRQTFSSTKLQTPRLGFQFSDFPWPQDVTADFPGHDEVVDYLERYAQHFGVLDCVRFNSKVVKVQQSNKPGLASVGIWGKNGGPFPDDAVWEVGVQNVQTASYEFENQIEWQYFDFVVLCIGKYGDLPKLPSFSGRKGPEIFQGTVLHALDYSALNDKAAFDLIKGKRIAIIGCQRSAVELAMECAEANPDGPPCTLVFSRAHWKFAEILVWGVPVSYFIDSRIAQFIIAKPGKGFLHELQWKLLTPLRWAVSKIVELYLLWTLPLKKYGLDPQHSFIEDFSSSNICMLPDGFFATAEKGCLRFQRAPSWTFVEKGILVGDGSEVEADIVVMCTGYDADTKLKRILSQPLVNILEQSDDLIPLYRGIIHPRIPHMAILGYSESISNLFSTEMRSRWLACFLSEKITLPNVQEMEDDIEKYNLLMKRLSRFYTKSSHAAFHIWQNGDICRDMGWNPYRKQNWWSELFTPYSNYDYQIPAMEAN